ncbi:hypothetical protein DLREEDagrD3_24850 [Denitratisoma sp. agr-D3]
MNKKPDPFLASATLVDNAVTAARVLGENPRISRLVASSVGRFAAELAPEEGQALIRHALARIGAEEVPLVPKLHGGLDKLLADNTVMPLNLDEWLES